MPKNSFSQEKKWYDIEQNKDAWLDMRMCRVGGSLIGSIMANLGKAFGPPAHAAALKIALERITGHREEQTFNSAHFDRGHEQEPVAIALYEDTTFTKVTNGGFFECGDLIGVSPDGCVCGGLIEVKSVISTVHYATLERARKAKTKDSFFDPKYKWQMLLEMGGSGLPWVDFAEYCSEFPEGKRIYIHRLHAEEFKDEMDSMEARLDEFSELVDNKVEFIKSL